MSLNEVLNLFIRWPLVFRLFLSPPLVSRDVVTLHESCILDSFPGEKRHKEAFEAPCICFNVLTEAFRRYFLVFNEDLGASLISSWDFEF